MDIVLWSASGAPVSADKVEWLVAKTEGLHKLWVLEPEGEDRSGACVDVADEQIERVRARGTWIETVNEIWLNSWSSTLIFVRDDVTVTPGWDAGLRRSLEQTSDIAASSPLSNVGWLAVPEHLDVGGVRAANPLPKGWDVDRMAAWVRKASTRSVLRIPIVETTCVAFRRRVLEVVGGLDPELHPAKGQPSLGGALLDYCLRLRAEGFSMTAADEVWVQRADASADGLEASSLRRLETKHGPEILRTLVREMTCHVGLAEARRRIAVVFEQTLRGDSANEDLALSELNSSIARPRILFVLPVAGGHGGVHVIVENAVALRELGCRTCVAVQAQFLGRFRSRYPGVDPELFLPFHWNQVADLGKVADVAIATIFTSVELVRRISAEHPDVLPAYFIQDYEPWFVEPESELEAAALASYDLIPNMLSFALTDWVRRTVRVRHGVEVKKVRGCLDTDLFHDRGREDPPTPGSPVRVAAMVRPSTPRRNPRRTLQILQEVQSALGEQVDICTFGCPADDLDYRALALDFPHRHVGSLSREQVASLLRECDVFADLSTYQAFGRTALEAMACGCAAIVPLAGGADDYAVDEENALVVDTTSNRDMVHAISRLVVEEELRHRLIARGLETAASYGIHQAAQSELEVIREALAEHRSASSARTN